MSRALTQRFLEEVRFQGEFMSSSLRARIGLLTPAELAAMLEVSEDTLREWRRLKQGPDFVKCGKTVMYREADVTKWLEMNVVPTNRSSPG